MKHELDPTTLTQAEIYEIEARRYKLNRAKTAYDNYIKASPARKASMQKYTQLRKYRAACSQLIATSYLVLTPQEQETLRTFAIKVNERLKDESHTFTVCPSCYRALSGKSPTKRFTNFSSTVCTSCGAKHRTVADVDANGNPYVRPSNMRIRSKFTRAEAINHIRTHHPEIFI